MTTTKYAALYPAVAPRSTELIQVLVRGAANVPMPADRLPRCHVTICNESDISSRGGSRGSETHATINSTNTIESDSPLWNELLWIEVSEDFASREALVIMIIDEPSNRILSQSRILWHWLTPFYQYHLNLQTRHPETNGITSLYVSLMKKLSTLHKDNSVYFGLETVIDRFDVPLAKNISCFAAVRVVPDYEYYRAEHMDNPSRRPPKVQFKKVISPNHQDFILPQYTTDGYPQVSLASRQSALQYWKHNFHFTHSTERDAMFTNRNAALVIEFYNNHPIANNNDWHLNALIGWTVVRLDGRTRNALVSEVAVNGMRTEGLWIEHEGDLMPSTGKHESVRVFLRLISEKHPVKNLLTMMRDDLPVLPSYQAESQVSGGPPPVYKQIASTSGTVFPPIVTGRPPAIRSPVHVAHPVPVAVPQPLYPPAAVYPNGQQASSLLFHPPRINPYDLDDIPSEYRVLFATNYPPRRDDDIDGWFDYFQREIAMYKQAVRRILQDVKQLKEDNQKFTGANDVMKKQIEVMEKKKKVIYEVLEGDKIDKTKIQRIIDQFESRIASQKRQLREDQIRIEKYEKELAARSQLREEYDKLYRTHQALELQMKLLQERLGKADGLEETVRRQEMVIERLEARFQTYMQEKRARGTFNDLDRTFLAEHAALGLDRDEFRRSAPRDRVPPGGSAAQSRVKFSEPDTLRDRTSRSENY